MITITPFEALAPYMEAATASFKIVIFSTLSGLTDSKSSPLPIKGYPSTTIKGVLTPEMVESPLITIVPLFDTETPALCPSSIVLNEGCNLFSSDSEVIVEYEPVDRSFDKVWYPVTITSPSLIISSSIDTLINDLLLTGTNCSLIPINEKTRTSFGSAEIEYAPFRSVTWKLFLFFILI